MSDSQQPAPSTPSSPPDLFDLDKLRIGQDFEAQLGVKKHVTTVSVRKPTRQEWIRVRPGEQNRLQTVILEVKEERDSYLVDPALWPDLQDVVVSKVLVLCVTKVGVPFIWPIKLPGADGRLDAWNDSALTAVGIGEKSWVSVRANM